MLWVTEQTVKFHLSNIYRELDVANRTEASRWAQLQGLLSTRHQHEAQEEALTTSAPVARNRETARGVARYRPEAEEVLPA